MNNDLNDSAIVPTPGRGRKRIRDESNWAKNRRKRDR